jgi:hypothetical protein
MIKQTITKWLLPLALALSGCGPAGPSPQPSPQPLAAPMGFKDLVLGQPLQTTGIGGKLECGDLSCIYRPDGAESIAGRNLKAVKVALAGGAWDATQMRYNGTVSAILLQFASNDFDAIRAAYDAKYPALKCEGLRTICFYVDPQGNRLIVDERSTVVEGGALIMTTAAYRAEGKAAETKDLKDI